MVTPLVANSATRSGRSGPRIPELVRGMEVAVDEYHLGRSARLGVHRAGRGRSPRSTNPGDIERGHARASREGVWASTRRKTTPPDRSDVHSHADRPPPHATVVGVRATGASRRTVRVTNRDSSAIPCLRHPRLGRPRETNRKEGHKLSQRTGNLPHRRRPPRGSRGKVVATPPRIDSSPTSSGKPPMLVSHQTSQDHNSPTTKRRKSRSFNYDE